MIKLRVGPVVVVVNCKKLKENVIFNIKIKKKMTTRTRVSLRTSEAEVVGLTAPSTDIWFF